MQKDCKFIDDCGFCQHNYCHIICRGKDDYGFHIKKCPYYKKRLWFKTIKQHKDKIDDIYTIYFWQRKVERAITNINLWLLTRGDR